LFLLLLIFNFLFKFICKKKFFLLEKNNNLILFIKHGFDTHLFMNKKQA